MDLSQFSESDLDAIINGDMGGVSEAGLDAIINDQSQPAETSFAETISNDPRMAMVSKYSPQAMLNRKADQIMKPVVEPVARLGTGAVGKVAGDIAGMGALIGAAGENVLSDEMSDIDPAAVKQRVQGALTYEPVTSFGQSSYHPLNAATNAAGAGLGYVTSAVADPIRGDPSQYAPVRQGIANAAEEGLPQLLGYYGLKYGLRGVKKVADGVTESVMGHHIRKAQNVVNEAVGQDPTAMRNIRAAADAGNPESLTTAQAAVHRGMNPAVAGLDRVASDLHTVGRDINSAKAYQSHQITKELERMGGGPSQETALTSQQAARSTANQLLEPTAKAALREADNFTQAHRAITKELNEAQSLLGKPGAKQAIDAAKAKLDALPKQIPLTPDAIIAKVDNIVGQFAPGVRPHIEDVINTFVGNIRKAANANDGYLNAADIRHLRKTHLTDPIESSLRGVDTAVKQDTVRALVGLKPVFDNMIENAGGTGWKSYNAAFADRMRDISRMKVAQTALEANRTGDTSKLANIGRGDAPQTIEGAFGQGNYELSRTGPDAATYQNITAHLDRNKMLSDLADRGGDPIRQILKQNTSRIRLPNPLSPTIALINKTTGAVENLTSKKMLESAAGAMRSPQDFLDLMTRQPLKADSFNWMNDPNAAAAGAMLVPGMMSREKSR